MRTALKGLIIVLVFIAAVVALCVSWLLCPGQSEAEEGAREAPAIELVEPPLWDGAGLEERAAEIRAEESKRRAADGRNALETKTREELLAAALRLQPSLEKQPRHAKRVTAAIYEETLEAGFDPFLILAFASRESGLRANVRGALGEEGLLQLHGRARRVCGRGRDLGQPRANIDAALCWLREAEAMCGTRDLWIVTAAYGTGKCLSLGAAKRLDCTRRKRAELVKAVGEERAATIWPEV